MKQLDVCPGRADICTMFRLPPHWCVYLLLASQSILTQRQGIPCWGHRIYWHSKCIRVPLCTEVYYRGKITRTAQKTVMHTKAQFWSTQHQTWSSWQKQPILCSRATTGRQALIQTNNQPTTHQKKPQKSQIRPACPFHRSSQLKTLQ